MILQWNIILWTTSLLLSTISISFAFIAARFSTKSNHRLNEIIQSLFIAEESQKYFYDSLRVIQNANAKIKTMLNSKITYRKYFDLSRMTRLVIIPKKMIEILHGSEFFELAVLYKNIKKELDSDFLQLKEKMDTKLTSAKTVPISIKKELKEYHANVALKVKVILVEYSKKSIK